MNRNHLYTGQQATQRSAKDSTNTNRNRLLMQSAGIESGNGGASLTMANAPTSLANLAQLSGITLLPIGAYNAVFPNITSTGNQTAALNCNLSQNPVGQHSSHRAQSKKHSAAATAAASCPKPASSSRSNQSNDGQFPRVFNVSSIPSIQSLNQTSNEPIFRRNIDVLDHSRSQFNSHTQSMSSANILGMELSERLPKTLALSHQTNGIQVIPVSSSLSSLQYMSHSQRQTDSNQETMNSLSDNIMQSNNYVDINGDANNISLVKLMAILNNPALTITAVAPKEQTNDLNDDALQHDSNIFETLDRPNSSRLKQNNLPSQISNSSNATRYFDSKLRLPQSAANLQMIHDSQLQTPSGMAQLVSVDSSKSETLAAQQFEQRHNDFKQDWLSDCNRSSKATTTNMQVQYQNDLYETNCNTSISSNPTILSTSVRNLLMQQISQGTNKQQNRCSAQLLRHIANQEQDNDISSYKVQNPLPIVEPVFIPGHNRVIKQLSDDVKIIKTEQNVSTSCLIKKKSKGPTKTSRYRLYVPGMENGNLRHSRTNESRYYLNDILISNSQARETHLSDRHSMLDTMMRLEDKKERKNEPTEPDEIFINRSKRVMSKIDTMLERKKRRRFERISGREPPKNNSIEDQCAESEEEWSSDDEAMDLNSVGIIKTQLPLDEFETQTKKNHFMSVGLVSRETKHAIEAELCERKLNLITPLALETLEEPSEDIHKFVHTVVKTNGESVELRVDSNIKRNDLPLVEGLNRNTSRLKMSYMNLLGLEKRSKRTTLYKVKQIENTSTNLTRQQPDLSKTSRELNSDELHSRLDTQRQLFSSANLQARSAPQQALRIAPSNCRNILKLPNKNDYMKSLGLMAS